MTQTPPAMDGWVMCWCCGEQQDESSVVRLGDHPEVTLCLRCAHFVHRRAQALEDAGVRTVATRVRGVVRACESLVVQHDVLRKPVIGPLLRWLGPRLP